MNRTTIKNKLILCFIGLILVVMAVVVVVNMITSDFLIAQGVCTALALVAGVLFGSVFSRSIVKRLNELNLAAERISVGDLTCDIDVVSRDEIRDLEEVFSLMLQQIRAMLIDIRAASEQVRKANNALIGITRRLIQSRREIDRVSQEIAEGSEAQTLIVQETSVKVTATVETMDRIGQQSVQTISKIRDAIEKTKSGADHAKETLKHLEVVIDKMREYAAPISRLTGKVEKIRGIIGVMDNIAQKTDLLALNASIEATRAGETGKGFALVAEEIRGMADSSKQSSARISGLIEEILEDNQQVSNLLDNNQQDINKGTHIIHGIVQTFDEMLTGVKEIFDEVQTMEKMTSEQREQMTGMTDYFQGIYDIAKKNFVSTQKTTIAIRNQKNEVNEIVRAVKGLSGLSNTMVEKQQRFRLPELMQ
jgi:methyl-accepting chemotaxis protein